MKIPNGSIYEGTRQTLTCIVVLPDYVDTDVNVVVEWLFESSPLPSNDRINISQVTIQSSLFFSTLTFSPIGISDTGQYSCQSTVSSLFPHITTSLNGDSDLSLVSMEGMYA